MARKKRVGAPLPEAAEKIARGEYVNPRGSGTPLALAREHKAHIAQGIASMLTDGQISQTWGQLHSDLPPLHKGLVRKLRKKIVAEWAEDARRTSSPETKAVAVHRLENDIRLAKAAKAWGPVASMHKLLADIQGTKAPIRVQVDVAITEALTLVLGGMTSEQLVRELEAARSEGELATKYRREVLGEVVESKPVGDAAE